ncbi:hypothetical protein BJX65DRAFT_312020 [Aspergillus insuetus]
MTISKPVLVVIGSGGIGIAIARRLGSGSHIILADFSPTQLEGASSILCAEGYSAETVQTDISNLESVQDLARRAAQAGRIGIIAHTAGLSPQQASPDRIYHVNLLGTALIIDCFLEVASAGTSLVVIASMAGHTMQGSLCPEFESHLATSPVKELMLHRELENTMYGTGDRRECDDDDTNPAAETLLRVQAYGTSKRGNILRVQAAALAWSRRGARINSVSPGMILTAMGRQELDGPFGAHVREEIGRSPAGRFGTADDVANVVAFLSGREAAYITGNDILVDGGWTSSRKWSCHIE